MIKKNRTGFFAILGLMKNDLTDFFS